MILILTLIVGITHSQVDHHPINPDVSVVKIGSTVKTVPSNTAFKHVFRAKGYDIGGAVYQTHNGLLNDQLHNHSFYNKSKACTLYRSELKLQLLSDTFLTNVSIQTSMTCDSLHSIFLIISNDTYDQSEKSTKILKKYTYNSTSIIDPKLQIPLTSIGLNDSEELSIKMLVINSYLLITDGVKAVSVDPNNLSDFKNIKINIGAFEAYDYKYTEEHQFLKLSLCHYYAKENEGIIMALWDTSMRIYTINQVNNRNQFALTLIKEFTPPNSTYYADALPDMGRYWALTTNGVFIAYRPTDRSYSTDSVELQSRQCFQLNKYETTLHVICRQGEVNYVAQFYLNQSFVAPSQALKLNQYYNQLQDVKLLFRFGGDYNPKLLLIGDYELMMVPYAINRMVLMQTPYGIRQQKLLSLGIEMVHTIPTYSNFSYTAALGISQNFIALFGIIEQAPQMECQITRKQGDIRWNILVELNTSSCLANGEWQQLQSICQYRMPFSLYAGVVQVDAANHSTIVATVLLLLLATAIVLVGCGLYCNVNIQKAKGAIRAKLAALSQKKEMKAI